MRKTIKNNFYSLPHYTVSPPVPPQGGQHGLRPSVRRPPQGGKHGLKEITEGYVEADIFSSIEDGVTAGTYSGIILLHLSSLG